MGRSVAQQAEDNRRRRAAGQPEVPISYDSGPPNPAERPTSGYGEPATPAPVTPPPPPPPYDPVRDKPVSATPAFNPPAAVQANTPALPTYNPVASVNPVTTVTSQSVNPVVAGQSTGATIGGANTVQGQVIDPVERAKATLAANTTINSADSDQVRAQQMDFLSLLRDAAYGEGGPTAAENLFKRASDEAIKSQFALAAGAHGYAQGAANRQAGFNAANLQAGAARDAAILRAQEQQAARGLFGQTLGTTRESDMKLAIAQANLDQATAALNANLSTNVDMSNASEVNKRNQLQAELDQATAFRNAAADEAIRVRNAEMAQQNSQFNVGQENAVNMFNTGQEQQNRQFNVGQQNQGQQFNAELEQQRNMLDAQLQQNLGISLAQLQADINKFNAGQGNQNTQFYAGLQNTRDIAQLEAALRVLGYTNDQIRAFLGAYSGAAGAVARQDTANRQEQDKFFWDLVNIGANAMAPGSGSALKTAGAPTATPGGYAGLDPGQINTGNIA